ncbi:MAG TPA: formate dehydrogenase accessory sulfurtransferase FdhD [Tepidisphaeraceae bacterium]|jgi:FdhD protein
MDQHDFTTSVIRWDDGRLSEQSDELAVEEPLEIRVRGRPISITMRTPGHDDELAAGFLLSEGVIGASADILRTEHCGRNEADNVLNVTLAPMVAVDLERLTRHVFGSSSCGICGKATIQSVRRWLEKVDSPVHFCAESILKLPAAMQSAQATFHRTGGLHAASIFDEAGRMLVLREDVGRHNAVDKVIGHCLLHGPFPLDRHVLMVSGRSSFEIMQKSLSARIPVVAAVSAPSSLAVEFATESRQTLIGFLRERRMNIYANSDRIQFTEAQLQRC